MVQVPNIIKSEINFGVFPTCHCERSVATARIFVLLAVASSFLLAMPNLLIVLKKMLVILSVAKNLIRSHKILRYAQDDKGVN